MSQYFRKFPYPGWIVLFFVFLFGTIVVYQFEKKQLDYNHLAHKIQSDFNRKEAVVYVDAKTGFFIKNMKGTVSLLKEQDYDWIILKNGQRVSWNNNNISLPDSIRENPHSFLKGQIVHLNYTTYFVKSWELDKFDSAYALTFIPIAYQFAFENKYFQSRFLTDSRIPISTILSNTLLPGAIPILANDKKVAFYVQFSEQSVQTYVSSFVVWLFALSALFCLFIIVHKTCIEIAKKRSVMAFSILVGFVIVFTLLLYFFGLPIGMKNAGIFSPNLLSSGNFITSFGSLFYLALCDTWALLFVLIYMKIPPIERGNTQVYYVIMRLVSIALLVFILYFIEADRIYKLIIDSKISFEVSDFTRIDIYTFLGLFVLSIITLNFIFTLQIILDLLQGIFKEKIIPYLFVGFLGLLCIEILYNEDLLLFYFIILFMCIAGMVMLKRFGLPILLNNNAIERKPAHGYIWFIILCTWISVIVFYFNFTKEREIRKVYAGKQEQKNDVDVAFAYDDLSQNIQGNKMLLAYLSNPASISKLELDRQLSYSYISGVLSKYEVSYYYFDKNRLPLIKLDSAEHIILKNEKKELDSSKQNGLIYLNNVDGRSLYWGMIPILGLTQSGRLNDTLGFVGINFAITKHPQSNFATSILQRKYNPSDQQYFDKYTFAIYKNGNLWTQSDGSPFPYKAINSSRGKQYHFKEGIFNSTLYYKVNANELILVSFNRNIFVNYFSLFSFILGVLLLLVILILFLRYFIFHPLEGKIWAKRKLSLTIQAKINLTVLITVFLSLSLVGIITVSFLRNRYKNSQQESLKNFIFYFGQNLIHYIEDEKIALNSSNQLQAKMSAELNYRLNALAKEQSLNINLYDKDGILIATSQSRNVQNNFMSNYMNRSAFLNLKTGSYSDLFIPENIGNLNYESLYLPLRNRNDEIIAYMNLPYYSSQIKLKEEISKVLVDLINIYTLIFLISGLAAVFVSNNIVKTFNLLIEQFRSVRLQHNVLLKWPKNDELSLLVREYNAMILKVEDLAKKLASNEREAGWRDLALQVAHEIKNPLTPMKLNIQFLQSAIKDKRADTTELTTRITQSIIEEIENLNTIASEFAYFAKMPEANPELLSLKSSLSSIAELFQTKNGPDIQLELSEEDIYIFIDKSNFRRIMTNIIKNATQAIPEERAGLILINYKRVINEVIIEIKDNGLGIAAELQSKLFTHYFTTKTSGTGIGLSMSRKMVENASGKIWFETEKGVGTSFFIEMPITANL